MDAIWASIVSVIGTGFAGLLGAVLLGKLVPVSRVDKAEKEAATWKQSYDSMKAAFDAQSKLLERQQLTAEITDKVMAAVRDQVAAAHGSPS